MTTVLLLMDFQVGIVERFGNDDLPTLRVARSALDAARSAGVAIVFVRVAFREGAPEVSARNVAFAHLAGSGMLTEQDVGTRVHPSLAPRPGEIVVTKRRVGAFTGSDLDVVLRALDADHLVLAGISTSGVVLSTLRHAADEDFRLSVLADACADADVEGHRVLIEKVFPRQAHVLTVGEWIASLAGPSRTT